MTIEAIDRAPIAVPTELARGRGGGGPASKRVVENNEPTGKLIALQIKTGASHFCPKASCSTGSCGTRNIGRDIRCRCS
jgi:hypothetical protein